MPLMEDGRQGGAAPAAVTLESVPRKGAGIVSRTIAGECLLIPVTRRAADMSHLFTLGDVSAFVWERIDGARSLRSILADVLAEYDVAAAEAEGDLVALAAQLRDLGAVELA
jgi:hypothetical protein